MDTIAVWVSCGLASAVAAKKTIERFGATHRVRLVNNPVREEGDDNRRFLADVEAWCGLPIEDAINPAYPACSAEEVWRRRGAMAFPHGAPCTYHLKKEARQLWERENPIDWHVLGFTADERKRHKNFVLTERSNVLPILIDAGITKQDCADIVRAAGIREPEAYGLGYPNANCRGCVKATSPTYWNLVRQVDPKVFDSRAQQSRELGVRPVRHKGQRIYLDELPEDARGKPLKSLRAPDCGSFCEERLDVDDLV